MTALRIMSWTSMVSGQAQESLGQLPTNSHFTTLNNNIKQPVTDPQMPVGFCSANPGINFATLMIITVFSDT